MSERMDLAIVTCCHNYGRYLEAWAGSLVAMTEYPVVVAIVDAGSTDDTPAKVEEAREILETAGIEVRAERIESTNIGTARNAAVQLSGDTEWVQHLDCDDEAMPHMVANFRALQDRADVIGAGYERFGDLRAGPSNRKRLYRSHQGQATLDSSAPCSGVSPFRRSFFDRSPYREDMIGGWDTALWLGFAHADPPARFVATKRPVFRYRQHRDSVFNARRKNERRSKLVGYKLNALRKGFSGVSVVVPWATDGGARGRAWEWVARRYAKLHPEWEVVEGRSSGHWSKGEAVNDALTRATGWTIVIADADCVLAPESLEQAVRMSQDGAPWVIPHRMVHRLSDVATARVLGSEVTTTDFSGGLARGAYEGFAGGGFVVIERAAYEASGGIPEAFTGWGAEDEALAVILDTLIGPHVRLEHDLFHLWHPSARKGQRPSEYQQNRRLHALLTERAGQPDAMWRALEAIRNGGTPGTTQNRGVRMVALKDFPIGTRQIVRGQTFTVTTEQARRFRARRPPVAIEKSAQFQGLVDEMKAEGMSAPSLRDRKLAMAGVRTRAEHRARQSIEMGADA